MPRFKKAHYSARNDADAIVALDVEINIDADGAFYANLPDYLRPAFDSKLLDFRSVRPPAGKFRACASTFAHLNKAIGEALNAYATPEITETPVILYNIESHVAFAEDEAGNIYPNARFPDAHWPSGEEEARYGKHHATHRASGGYSLVVGAKAMLKKTIRFGTKERIEYENYYKGDSHLEHDNPAQLLNAWVAMDLGKSPREMPYSDKAALFFHSLLMGMAEINRRIQAATFDQQQLLALIEQNSSNFLLLPGTPSSAKP